MRARRAENRRMTRGPLIARIAPILLLAVLAGWASAGCRGGTGDAAPPCSAVGTRFLQVARHDLDQARVDDATRRAVADQLPAMRDALAQACTEGRWSPSVRDCLVAAGDHAAFEACEQQLTDEQRRDLDRANRASGGTSP
jgi:hypothetical protein